MRATLRGRALETTFWAATALCALAAIGALAFMLCAILAGGHAKLSPAFLVTPSAGAGYDGGVLYQIVGTLLLIGVAALVVMPFATALALMQTTFLRSPRARQWITIALHVLNGTPSILFGILGFVFFVKMLGWDKSWLAGSLILAVMILPTVTVALVKRIETIPRGYVEAARALGFDDNRLVWAILVPYGWGGLLTGLVLGLARAAGETAPIMFTAAVFSGATIPTGIRDNPVLALPYHIFTLAQDTYGEGATAFAWATAAVLTALVVCISLVALPFRARSHEEAKK